MAVERARPSYTKIIHDASHIGIISLVYLLKLAILFFGPCALRRRAPPPPRARALRPLPQSQ